MQLREGMISLAAALRRGLDLQCRSDERPKDADVKAWLDLVANGLCAGEPNKELRSYLKALGNETWKLVNWLTHDRNANKTAALIAHESVTALNSHFARLLMRERADRADQCPVCASRNIRFHFDIALEPEGTYETCGACGWSNHPGHSFEDDQNEGG